MKPYFSPLSTLILLSLLVSLSSCNQFRGNLFNPNGPTSITDAPTPTPSALAPQKSWFDSAGNMFLADSDNNVIRKLDANTSIITTVAGTGVGGYSGDGGLATAAQLYYPVEIVFDASGNLYFVDQMNHMIRKIDKTTGIISKVAGTGVGGYSGDGGLATAAQLGYPTDLAFDVLGNLHIADYGNHSIRKVDKSTGIISTVAGSGSEGYAGDGGLATAAQLAWPIGISFDKTGNLYIADYINNVIRKVDQSTGFISTVAGTGNRGYNGDGGAAIAAELGEPIGPIFDEAENFYIMDSRNFVVRKVDANTGVISTIAGIGSRGYSGDGGPALAAELGYAGSISFDAAGNLYIADCDASVIRKIDKITGIISTVVGNGNYGYSGDGGPGTTARLAGPFCK